MHKYNAKKTKIDGITFASRKEADYYNELCLRKRARDIKDFSLQPKFILLYDFVHGGKKYKGISYTADFKIEHNDGTSEIIECKGFKTKDYILRKKLLLSQYPDLKFSEV